MADRQLLGYCAAVGVADDVGFLDADCVEDPGSNIRQHRHRVGNDWSLARADPGTVEGNDISASKRVGEIRPALHWAGQPVEQQQRLT
jgi:hypothetical protein